MQKTARTIAAALGTIVCALLLNAGSARAAAWTNLAVGSTVGGNQGDQSVLTNQEVNGSRWHQNAIDFDADPGRIYFQMGSPADIGFARFWNWSDNVGGPMGMELQALTGSDPNLDTDWTTIPGSSASFGSVPSSYYVSFPAVNTSALRWYITPDNNVGGAGNLRYTEFEFYSQDQNALDLTSQAIEISHSTDGDISATAADGLFANRYNGPDNQPQKVTILWDGKPLSIEHFRMGAEDPGQRIETWSLEYLQLGGDPNQEADWLATDIDQTSPTLTGSFNLLAYDLNVVTLGLRLNIADPSTNGDHEILRLWELEAFGSRIPEPGTAVLAALGTVGMFLRRRR